MRYFIILTLFIIIILLILPIEFIVEYKYTGGYSKLNVRTSYLFGLLKPEIYPFDKEKKSRHVNTGFIARITSIQDDNRFKKFVDIIWNKLVIKEINWETKIGFKDAYFVGIISGSLWCFKSIITSFLMSKKEIKNLYYNVIPIFDENYLDILFDCIIKIRMVYIITVWIWLLKLKKGGEKGGRTSNRRFNENYNE
ncbi:DUF2953 domain-containing protein [Clostridium sp. Cult2]|uniref:DUF2953 domain-containing protein n=1 Tax=Clostridium sp. Cult2 TaxID=2079003 RepID=UPI001F2E6179|nr:DUF2953 domain-containing protein [Clostridium sp. Cult2]MCF6465111.1 hypothetical protein [Clostridium sp. Cult2]